ncbi:hypothetical protein ACSHWB_05865 [Lentzea sp. HUAS TT2]|uniref:hypothetical protein n=1 Tax=Lentzea sp. HUAS TT2 TaxID=3447454 RepID=UPI003F7134A4
MPEEPYRGLAAALESASDWGLTLSALGCIHRASAVLVAAGVVEEDVAPFSAGSLVELGETRDVAAVLSAVRSKQQSLAVYAADPETGELPEETDRASLLSMASELVLRATGSGERSSLQEWSDFCSSLAVDIAQELDCMELTSVAEFDSNSPAPYEDVPSLPAQEIWTQLEILRLLDSQDADVLSRIADLSGALRSALVVIAAEAVSEGDRD